MKHHRFTDEQRNELQANPNIAKVLNSNVEYTPAFKAYALTERENGKLPHSIFSDAGIPDWINIKSYAGKAMDRWKVQKGKPPKKRGRKKEMIKSVEDMSVDELRARLAYVEAENEFLKNIKAL